MSSFMAEAVIHPYVHYTHNNKQLSTHDLSHKNTYTYILHTDIIKILPFIMPVK